jgi:hypothetical protein
MWASRGHHAQFRRKFEFQTPSANRYFLINNFGLNNRGHSLAKNPLVSVAGDMFGGKNTTNLQGYLTKVQIFD